MNPEIIRSLQELLPQIQGYIYPNEIEIHWGLLIVVYPYITGVVAGAFILASLVKVFNVKEVQPLYRLSLLTALAYLLVAPMALVSHLGHPGRFYEILLTPQTSSAMAMFGFVYAWYLMAVLLLEIWFVHRTDMIDMAENSTGAKRSSTVFSPSSRRTRGTGRRVRPQGTEGHHHRRDPVGVPAPRVRRVHLRLDQGEPVVEQRAHPDRLPLLRHRVRDRAGRAPLHDHHPVDGREDQHEVRRQGGRLPLLRRHRRLLARNGRLHPPGLPERGGDQDPLRDGDEQAVREPHHHPGPPRDAGSSSCSSPSPRSSRSASA